MLEGCDGLFVAMLRSGQQGVQGVTRNSEKPLLDGKVKDALIVLQLDAAILEVDWFRVAVIKGSCRRARPFGKTKARHPRQPKMTSLTFLNQVIQVRLAEKPRGSQRWYSHRAKVLMILREHIMTANRVYGYAHFSYGK